MGRFATTTSISVLMPNWLSGNTTSSDSYGADVWSSSADRAEAEVVGAIVARYDPTTWTTTGSPAIPPLIRKLSQDLACLYAMKSSMVEDTQIRNPNIDEWERAASTLAALAAGTKKLAYTDGSLVPTRSSSRFLSSASGFSHIFNVDSERNWEVDTDQIDAIDSERA